MYDLETKRQFIRHRALGKSVRSLSAIMHISETTLYKWDAECESEIKGLQDSGLGLALAESGADRIERAKTTATIYNHITKKLLDAAASNALPDLQLLALYIKLCQLLDKADPPVTPDADEPGCDLPDSIDLLANVKRPQRVVESEHAVKGDKQEKRFSEAQSGSV
jgi:hypothetical protein